MKNAIANITMKYFRLMYGYIKIKAFSQSIL